MNKGSISVWARSTLVQGDARKSTIMAELLAANWQQKRLSKNGDYAASDPVTQKKPLERILRSLAVPPCSYQSHSFCAMGET